QQQNTNQPGTSGSLSKQPNPPLQSSSEAPANSASSADGHGSAANGGSKPTETAHRQSSETPSAQPNAKAASSGPEMATAAPVRDSGEGTSDAAATSGAAATPNAMSGDAAAGRQVFRKCQACHSLEPGKNMLGPSLADVIGRKAGTEPGYS